MDKWQKSIQDLCLHFSLKGYFTKKAWNFWWNFWVAARSKVQRTTEQLARGSGEIKGTKKRPNPMRHGVETQSLWWSIVSHLSTLSIKKQKGPPLHLHYFFYKLIFYFKGIKQFSLKYAIMFFNYEYQSAKQTKASSTFRFLQMCNFFWLCDEESRP